MNVKGCTRQDKIKNEGTEKEQNGKFKNIIRKKS